MTRFYKIMKPTIENLKKMREEREKMLKSTCPLCSLINNSEFNLLSHLRVFHRVEEQKIKKLLKEENENEKTNNTSD